MRRFIPLGTQILIGGLLVGLGIAGCSHSTATTPPLETPTEGVDLPTPAGPIGPSTAALGSPIQHGDKVESALGLYTIHLNPTNLTATTEADGLRTGEANDDLYALGVDGFLRPDSFKVTKVAGTATTIAITYELSHPFAAPTNLEGTPTAVNRADLGITGLTLFLVDAPASTGHTWFSDRIAADGVITNADCYYAPAGLLNLSSVANTFPAMTLVDERGTTGSRVGVSNGGIPTGNFGADGWTRAELGSSAPYNQWTGYGALHQGQTSSRTVEINRAGLTSNGTIDLKVAILARYQDPRGGANAAAKKAHRLPPATPDATAFAYRGNHMAFDVAHITYEGESGGFLGNTVSASTLRFHVEDFDARAISSAQPDLKDDTNMNTVAQGENGVPSLAVCIPGVLGSEVAIESWDSMTNLLDDDSAFGGDVASDTGRPGDELFYSRSITNLVTTGQTGGLYTGMVRVTDPEAAITEPAYIIELDGNLSPLSSNIPTPVTYQLFQVLVGTLNNPPTAT
ncbi:MAG: hypothetical protein ABI743_12620, partial [bacterium]